MSDLDSTREFGNKLSDFILSQHENLGPKDVLKCLVWECAVIIQFYSPCLEVGKNVHKIFFDKALKDLQEYKLGEFKKGCDETE